MLSCNVGVYLFDKEGRVVLTCNQNLITDVTLWRSFDWTIDANILKALQRSESRVLKIYGYERTGIQDMVEFLQQSFLYSLNDMKYAADHILNFPVTTEQIAKFWSKSHCYDEGYMR